VTLITATVAAVLLSGSKDAVAVPCFARQTGMACEACHTVFPELTPFGRAFKLNGYLIDNLPQVKDITPEKKESLLLNWLPPLSVQFIASYTRFKTALPDPNGGVSQNGTVQFPEEASLFYAGRIAPQLGGFIQLTFDNNDDKVGWDNTDIRFADLTTLGQNRPLTWGISANNGPTVQDPWNSTPAWHYPFSQTSSLAPARRSRPLSWTASAMAR
jgi:iron:rusticyanin reductase